MIIFLYQTYQARLRECLLNREALSSESTCILKAKSGEPDIKSRQAGITHRFTHQIGDYDLIIDFISAGSPGTSLLDNAICTKISCAGLYHYNILLID